MRFRILDDGRLLDTLVGKKFQPRSTANREWADTLSKGGDNELSEILKRIDASEATKSRMAGERGIDELLQSLKSDVAAEERELDLESDAIQYISNRAVDLNQMGYDTSQPFASGGLGKAAAAVASLGELKGGVPMPIMRTGRDTQERVFTKYEDNPLTGQQQVVPMLDPNDETQAIKLTYGTEVPNKYTQADEYVSEAALKMLGYKVDMPQNNRVADFQVVDSDGYPMAIDGMQIPQGGPIDMQGHSFVGVKNGGRTLSVNELQSLIDRRVANGENVIDIVDQLADTDRTIGRDKVARKAGKLMRGDHGTGRVNVDEEYDALIMPEYNNANRNNRNFSERPNNRVIAPQGLWMADMPGAFDAVRAGQGGQPRVVRNKHHQDAHKINIPMSRDTKNDGQRVFIDLIKNRPELAQLLDTRTMEKMRVN